MRWGDIGNHAAICFGAGNKENGCVAAPRKTLRDAPSPKRSRFNFPVVASPLKAGTTRFGRIGKDDAIPPSNDRAKQHGRFGHVALHDAMPPAFGRLRGHRFWPMRSTIRGSPYFGPLGDGRQNRRWTSPDDDRTTRRPSRAAVHLAPCWRKRRPGKSTHEPERPTDGPARRRTAVAPTGHAHRATTQRASDWPVRSQAG